MNVYLKAFSISSGIVGGVIVSSYPILGGALLFASLVMEIIFFVAAKNEEEKKENFDFHVAKSLVQAGQPNPYKEILENELNESGIVRDLIPKYEKIFKVDSTDIEALSKILAAYGVLTNHEIAMYGYPQKTTVKEAKKYISLALKKFKKQLDSFSLVGIALTYDAIGDFGKSQSIYRELMLSNSKNTTVIDSYGMSLLMSNNIIDSIKLLKSAVNERNFTNVTLYNLGCANQALGHFSTANLYLTKSYRLSKRWKTLVRIAENYFLMGDFKAAFFTQVLCIFRGGIILKGSMLSAIVYLLLTISFGFAVILSLTIGKLPFIGTFYYKKFRPALWFQEIIKRHLVQFPDAIAESVKFLQELLIVDPLNEYVLYNLGVLNGKLGNKPQMLKYLNKISHDSDIQGFVMEISKLSEEELKRLKLKSFHES